MNTIIGLIVTVLAIWLVIMLLPVIAALIVIAIGAVLLFSIYMRYKVKKQMKQGDSFYQEFTQTNDTRNNSYESDDIIDVEFTETSEGDR